MIMSEFGCEFCQKIVVQFVKLKNIGENQIELILGNELGQVWHNDGYNDIQIFDIVDFSFDEFCYNTFTILIKFDECIDNFI